MATVLLLGHFHQPSTQLAQLALAKTFLDLDFERMCLNSMTDTKKRRQGSCE